MLSTTLEKVRAGQNLGKNEAYACACEIFDKDYSPEFVAEFLGALADKKEAIFEVLGFVQAMQERMIPLELGPGPRIDICGTGGSGKARFNVSTAVAFILAAGGVPVAKHGNRGSKLPNGSFDFIEALGIPLGLSADAQKALFEEFGLVFLFARYYHPAVAKVAPARQLLGRPSIFNILGPLCNPAGITHQLLGTASRERWKLLAEVLSHQNMKNAWVICGADGRDEISLTAPTYRYQIRDENYDLADAIDPKSFCPISIDDAALSAGNADQNAALFHHILTDRDVLHPVSLWIQLNAAAAFVVFGTAPDLATGFELAKQLIGSGKVMTFVSRYLSVVTTLA